MALTRALCGVHLHLGALVLGLVCLLLGRLGLLVGSLLAHHDRLGVSLLLQVQSHLIQASLGFVVHARRPLRVGREADRAQRLRLAEPAERRSLMVTLVGELAEWPLSSDTLHVIPTAPVGAPAEEYSAVVPLPVTVPAEAV